MAMTSDGIIWQWGGGLPGVDASATSNPIPASVSLNGALASGIALGDNFAMALTSQNTVFTWGTGVKGELGSATLSQSAAPVEVAGLHEVLTICAAEQGASALTRNGNLWTW
jgi:alpha-tubulin suppressor-like RCC1 family protein